MAVELQTQLFSAFLGTQQGIHSIILPDIFSSGGSKNVYVDKFARVSSLRGYTKQNSTAYTTVGGSSAIVRALIPYRAIVSGAETRKLLFALDDLTNEFEIWHSSDNGVTGSRLLTDSHANKVLDGAQYGTKLYLTNGSITPQRYDGSTLAAATLTQSPTPTATESASAGSLTGVYRYKLVSMVNKERQKGSASSSDVTVSGKQIDLSWTQDANTNVTGYEIYRTTGTGKTLYFVTTIDGRGTTSYTDNNHDYNVFDQRVLEEHGDPPPVGTYFCEFHKQRMWWLRTDTYPTRAYWSDPGEPESVYTENFLDFSENESEGGDFLTGALSYNGMLVVFTEKSVWVVAGTGGLVGDIVDWTKLRTNATIGAVSSRAAVKVPAGSKFVDQVGQHQTTGEMAIAYFSPLGDIRLFDGLNDRIISTAMQDVLKQFQFADRSKIHAVIDADNDQAIWFFPRCDAVEPDTAVAWNYRYGVWYLWTPLPFGHAAQVDTSIDEAVMISGEANPTKGAFIYKFLNGTTFDGNAINSIWMSKTLYGLADVGTPDLSHTKRFRWADLLFSLSSDANVTVEWLYGQSRDAATAVGSKANIVALTDTLVTADGSTILTADGSTITVGVGSNQVKVLLQTNHDYLCDTGVRIRVKST